MHLPPVVMFEMLTALLHLLALFAAFMLGKQAELPSSRWPKGTLTQGGWSAMRPYLFGIVGGSALLNVMPLLNGGAALQFGGGGYRGGYGGYGGY